jgi:hypothetical protein
MTKSTQAYSGLSSERQIASVARIASLVIVMIPRCVIVCLQTSKRSWVKSYECWSLLDPTHGGGISVDDSFQGISIKDGCLFTHELKGDNSRTDLSRQGKLVRWEMAINWRN